MVSYASEDVGYAHQLSVALTSLGKTFWLDKNNSLGGAATEADLQEAVGACQFVCASISPRYSAKWYTRLEAKFALAREGILAPVRLIPCLFEGELPGFLGTRNYVDFRHGDPDRSLAELGRALTSHAAQHSKREATAKWASAAVVAVALVTAITVSGRTAHEAAVRSVLTAFPTHRRLGEMLREDGHRAPVRKDHRVDAAIEAYGATRELVADVLTVATMRCACHDIGVPSAGSRLELAGRIIDAVMALT